MQYWLLQCGMSPIACPGNCIKASNSAITHRIKVEVECWGIDFFTPMDITKWMLCLAVTMGLDNFLGSFN
jgi:hypothetical protein